MVVGEPPSMPSLVLDTALVTEARVERVSFSPASSELADVGESVDSGDVSVVVDSGTHVVEDALYGTLVAGAGVIVAGGRSMVDSAGAVVREPSDSATVRPSDTTPTAAKPAPISTNCRTPRSFMMRPSVPS